PKISSSSTHKMNCSRDRSEATHRKQHTSFEMKTVASIIAVLLTLCSRPASSIEEPKLFGVLSPADPQQYMLFFSTMSEYQKLGATQLVYFLSIGGSEIYQLFNPSEATCIANSSYCYMTGKLPSDISPKVCHIGITLRINQIDHDSCLADVCPNIHSTDECQLRVHADTRECSQQPWPFEPCPYPPSVSEFLPKSQQYNKSSSENSTETRKEPQDSSKSLVLIGSFSVFFIAIGVTIGLLISVLRRPHVTVLYLIEPCDSDWQRLLKPPPKRQLERIKRMPGHSFSSVAAGIKELSRHWKTAPALRTAD
ncbi:hypothetical protein BOX15_Mlig011742g1, partial [Macrostomum lignano]